MVAALGKNQAASTLVSRQAARSRSIGGGQRAKGSSSIAEDHRAGIAGFGNPMPGERASFCVTDVSQPPASNRPVALATL